MKRALKIMLVTGIVGVLALMGLMTAAAQSGNVSVTRSFNPSPVPADVDEVTVTVSISGSYGVGSVTEELPPGFSYVSVTPSDITATEDGRMVSFPLVGETTFSYKVMTSGSAGDHEFSGMLVYGLDKTEVAVGENRVLTVEAAGQPGDGADPQPGDGADPQPDDGADPQPDDVSVTRSFDPSPVPADVDEVTVTISIVGSYGIGSVTETLPSGFSYVSVTPSDITATEDGRMVSFSLLGETTFSYKAMTSGSAGEHEFSGELVYGVDRTEAAVGDDRFLTVEEAAQQPGDVSVTVTRSFDPSPVPAGVDEVTVTISIVGSYGIGSVTEELPPGFSYVSVTPSDITATEDGRMVSFSLVGEATFSYKVMTSGSAGEHEFSGELVYGVDRIEAPVDGAPRVTVKPPVTREPTSPRRPSRGGVGVAPITAATATPAPTSAPTVEPTVEPTMEPATPEPTVDMMMMGPEGEQGEQGEQGDQGAQGDPGPRGETGARGPDGPQGAAGSDGSAGAMGAAGDLGPGGAVGQDGARGPTGQIGAAGQTGAAGDAGATGASGGVSILHIIALIIAIVALVAAGGAYLARRS